MSGRKSLSMPFRLHLVGVLHGFVSEQAGSKPMDVLHPRCAGLDVHKKTVVAAVRGVEHGKVRSEVRTFETTTAGLIALAEWLSEQAVTGAAMEATGRGSRHLRRRRRGAAHDLPHAQGRHLLRGEPRRVPRGDPP
jgi:hypothetical protein